VLCAGLLAVAGGVGGLVLLQGHQGTTPRPVAHPGRPPAGLVAALASPAQAVRYLAYVKLKELGEAAQTPALIRRGLKELAR